MTLLFSLILDFFTCDMFRGLVSLDHANHNKKHGGLNVCFKDSSNKSTH